jgi:uncharacterized protein (DUF2141 family)
MKRVFVLMLLAVGIDAVYAETRFTIHARNVIINGGTVYIGIYCNEKAYTRKTPDIVLRAHPVNEVVSQEVTLPEGEYVIGIHQDRNGNGEMDYGLFGIPQEPYGLSNMAGKIPGGYHRLKLRVTGDEGSIIIPLVKY